MDMGLLFPFQGYRVNHIRIPDDMSAPIRVFLKRDESRVMLCHCCGRVMDRVRGFRRCKAEDLTVSGRQTFIHFRRARGRCAGCKKSRMESCDFIARATPHLTARLAFWLYRLCEIATVTKVSELVQKNKMTLWRVDLEQLAAYFAGYKIPAVTHISIDEVYARAWKDEEVDENRDDRFFTIVTCLETSKVIWVEPSRRKAALDRFFAHLGPEGCAKIVVAATDQHDDYGRSIAQCCPGAIHVLDRFHLMKNFEEAVNETRKRLYKMLPQKEVRELARPKFRFVFLKAASRRSEQEQAHMNRVMQDNEAFFRFELIKERMLSFFEAKNAMEGRSIFEELRRWIWEAGFPELKSWWCNLDREWDRVANWFTFRVTTAKSEALNNVIKALKRRAYGYQNMMYFRLKILQVCGYLNSRYLSRV